MRRNGLQSFAMFAMFLAISGFCYAQEFQPIKQAITPLQRPLSYEGQTALTITQDLIARNDYKTALKQIDSAIKSDPKSGIPYMIKAYILDRQNESKKAADMYAKAISIAPDNGYVLNAYAVHLCDEGKYEQADAIFLKATADSNYLSASEALENAGKCSLKNNNPVMAEERARGALGLNPESVNALETMTEVKFKQSSFLEARAFMQRREALGPLSVPLLELAQKIEKSAGDDRAAMQYQKQLDILSQSQIQPPKGEGQKKP